MALDLKSLTAEDIEALKVALGVGTLTPRTGQRKVLTDLRAPQTAAGKLYRPHFEWSADTPPEGTVIPPFPRLYWTPDNVEHRFESQEEMDAKMAADPSILLLPPNQTPLTKQQILEREMASLSPEDREFLIAAQRTARMARIQEQMQGMSADDVAAVMASTAPAKAKKSA